MTAFNLSDWLQIDPNAKHFWYAVLFLFGLLCLYRLVTNGDFAARCLAVGVLLFGLWFLAGCSNGPTNPLGMTDRTRLRTDASVSIARSQSDAEIAKAQADQTARIAEAQAREASAIAASNAAIITEQSRQNGLTARAHAWAGMIPLALLIVGATVIISIVVTWQGRIFYARATAQTLTVQQPPMLDADKLRLLEDYAAQRNMRVIEKDGEYLLTDGQRTIKALLKG